MTNKQYKIFVIFHIFHNIMLGGDYWRKAQIFSLSLSPIPLSQSVTPKLPQAPTCCVFSFDFAPCCAYSKNTCHTHLLQENFNVKIWLFKKNALLHSHRCIRERLLLALSAVSVCSILILTFLASAKFSDFLLLLLPTLWSVVGILIPFLSRISMTWN